MCGQLPYLSWYCHVGFSLGWAAAVSDHGNDQPMLDALAVLLIAREPCNRTDRARCKQESITVSRL